MNFLADLIMRLLRWFYELSQQDSLSEDAKKDDKLKKDMRDRIDAYERELLIESDLRAKRSAGAPSGDSARKSVDP